MQNRPPIYPRRPWVKQRFPPGRFPAPACRVVERMMGMVFSRHRTYGTHRGVWLDLDEIRRHADVITVTGPCAVTCAEDIGEGAILRTLDGNWMEIFIADCGRDRFFCEPIPVSSAA